MIPDQRLVPALLLLLLLLSMYGAASHDHYDFDVDIDEQVTVRTSTKVDAEISLPAVPNVAMERMDERQAFAIVGVRNPVLQISDELRATNPLVFAGADLDGRRTRPLSV